VTLRRLTQLLLGFLALLLTADHGVPVRSPETEQGAVRVFPGSSLTSPGARSVPGQLQSLPGCDSSFFQTGFTRSQNPSAARNGGVVPGSGATGTSVSHPGPRRIVSEGRLDLAALSPGTRTPFDADPANARGTAREALIFTAETMPVDAAGDPALAFSLLGKNPGEDPLEEIFPISDENPFTMVIRGSQGEPGQTDDGDPADDSDQNPGDQDGDNSGGDDSQVDPGDPNETPGGETEPITPKPEAVLILPTTTGTPVVLCAEQLDQQQFRLNGTDVLKIQFNWFSSRRRYDHFLLVDDLNEDSLSDVCFTDHATGFCQIYYNAGITWTALPHSYLSTRPICATRLSFMKNAPNQIAFYSPVSNTVEILESRSDGSFLSSLGFPMTFSFDGIVDYDFNGDHFSDLVMNNFAQNTRLLYQNLRGNSLKAYRGVAPAFPAPLKGQFKPWPEDGEYSFWLCQFGEKFLVYLVNRNRDTVPGLLYGPLSPGACLLLGDFDQDGNVDLGFGSLAQ